MLKIKRLTALILVLVMILVLAGCGSAARPSGADSKETLESAETTINGEATEGSRDASETDRESQEKQESTLSGTNTGSDTLVVYFSRTGEQYGVGVIDEGNTAIAAKMIAEITGADTFEILPADDHYPMTYDELTDVAKKEQNDNARPAYITDGLPDLSKYDTVFIGAPVWWGDWPMICYTFFEQEDLSGKTLYPFSTHVGSGLSGFDKKLSSVLPDSTVGEGLAITGTDCQNDKDSVRNKVNDWLSGLEY